MTTTRAPHVRGVLAAALFVLVTLLAACGSSGTYYEKSPKAVQQALRVQDLPLAVLGSTVKGKRVTSPDDETVVIALLGPEQIEMMRFVVTVTPDGTGSRVAVAVRPPEVPHLEVDHVVPDEGVGQG